MKTKIKLPVNFKPCEGCRNFQALLWKDTVRCKELGLVFEGVAICVLRREKNGVHGRSVSDVHVCVPGDNDV